MIIAEYQNTFGPHHAITVPYDPGFVRTEKHHSNLYYGASLKALELLAEEKGYALIGSNSAGQNAYFVRNDRLGPFKPLSAEEAYIEGRIRESRNQFGTLTTLSGDDCWKEIELLPVLDVRTRQVNQLREYESKR
jgi:hypothetical protein